MSLLDIRKRFIKTSGRWDLVSDQTLFTDNGADEYINDGLRMLDRMVDIHESFARLYYPLAAGEYALTFQFNCRYITEVWINDNETKNQLKKYSFNDFRSYYNEPAANTSNGTPLIFTIAKLRSLETTDKESLGIYIDKTWEETDTKYDYSGIIIGPPADKDYIVEVSGMFKRTPLSNDSDENYWTLQEPDLLCRAALYKLEAFSRGTENAKNWYSAIVDDIKRLDFDMAAEESYGINQIEG